jgi:hypothetical protein
MPNIQLKQQDMQLFGDCILREGRIETCAATQRRFPVNCALVLLDKLLH